MPWSVQTPMSERQDFVEDALRGLYSMTDLCARYGISRRVGYKWLDRFLREGAAGLVDRSRRPRSSPHGLPERIRTDNGVPFATAALCRLSQLSVWWLKLGIQPELIEPSHPEQNGRHERMHKTLKAETTRPPATTLPGQQRRFTAFRAEYNGERPHEGLGNATPASCYYPSPRPFPTHLPAVEYPGHFRVYYVSRNGGIRFGNRWVNLTHVLIEEYVGLEEIDDGVWNVYFGSFLLGRFDERDRHIHGFHNRNKIGHQSARRSTQRVLPMSPV
jgi:hypothetical protein